MLKNVSMQTEVDYLAVAALPYDAWDGSGYRWPNQGCRPKYVTLLLLP
jgi:hypothetical protein